MVSKFTELIILNYLKPSLKIKHELFQLRQMMRFWQMFGTMLDTWPQVLVMLTWLINALGMLSYKIVYYDVSYRFCNSYFNVGLIGSKLLLTPRRKYQIEIFQMGNCANQTIFYKTYIEVIGNIKQLILLIAK